MNNYTIVFKEGGTVLEIGGGSDPLRNSEGKRVTYNIDNNPGDTVDRVLDINIMPWDIQDESYDGVYSAYCWEHVEWKNSLNFLKEIHRVLKQDGKLILITSNTLEQCRTAVEKGIYKDTVELLFGSQEFPNHGGVHKAGFSPEYATKLLKQAGFKTITIHPHPLSKTDMIIEGYKSTIPKEEKETYEFEREYFEDGTYGYREYRDFATHYSTARKLMETMKPESFLSVGCGRGYVARILNAEYNIPIIGMDISNHCEQTRVIKDFIRHDATKTPWNFSDKQFDVCFSINFLEHIPEEKIDSVIAEMIRVSKRGFHGIHMSDSPIPEMLPDIDKTHQIDKPKQWWYNKFKTIAPNYPVIIEYPRMIEYDIPEKNPPVSMIQQQPDDLLKLNLGSYLDMYYYGWHNIDILPLNDFAKGQCYHFIQHDVTKGLTMYNDNSVDIIYTSHLLEHLTREQGVKLLEECYRVMKKDGVIRVVVPDTKKITQSYVNGDIQSYRYVNTGVEKCMDDADAYYNLLLAGHSTIYDDTALITLLEKIGFRDVKRETPFSSRSSTIFKQTYPLHHSLSCIIEANK